MDQLIVNDKPPDIQSQSSDNGVFINMDPGRDRKWKSYHSNL